MGPIIQSFPVTVPPGFSPSDSEGDGVDFAWNRKPCPCQEPPFRPRWGGGFRAGRIRQGVRLDHRAIDIMGAEGLEIRSIGPGVVARSWSPGPGRKAPGAGHSPKGGHYVLVRDPRGWTWYYAHLRDTPLVSPGDEVAEGQVLGFLGRTGNAVKLRKDGTRYGCPHLHLALTAPNLREAQETAKALGVDFQGTKLDSQPLLQPLYERGWRV